MTFTHALSTNNYGPCRLIVATSAANGTHTTIASALTSASSGDTIFIRPGTYTENLTLKAGVNLCAFTCDAFTPNVSIVGNCTFTGAGTVSLSGIQLQTNGAALLTVSGSSNSIVNLTNCYFSCAVNPSISYTSSGASSAINIDTCSGNLTSASAAWISATGSGNVTIKNTTILNTGGSGNGSSFITAGFTIQSSVLKFPITGTSVSPNVGVILNSQIDSSATNSVALNFGNNATVSSYASTFQSGTATAISLSSGCTCNLQLCNINTSNTNATTGVGTLNHSGLSYSSSSFMNTSSTIVNNKFGRTGTFTPGIAFGGASVGVAYTAQTGIYTMIGNVVFFAGGIITSSKGSSTGNATITGFPIAAGSTGTGQIPVSMGLVTFTAGYTSGLIFANANSTTWGLAQQGTAVNIAMLTNTNFPNVFQVNFSGIYVVD